MKFIRLLSASALVLLISAPSLYAPFAAHQVIHPKNQKDLEFHIVMYSSEDSPYVRIDVAFNQKSPHLVICKEPRPSIPQDGFRKYLDYTFTPQNPSEAIEAITQLASSQKVLSVGTEKKESVTLILHKTVLERAYLCFDFPEPNIVFDGGYYYTVDLPAYLKQLKLNESEGNYSYNSSLLIHPSEETIEDPSSSTP